MRGRCGCEIRRRRLAADKHDKVRQAASTAKKRILCRMDLRALKARRNLDADAALVRLTRHKNIREEAGESHNDGRW